MDMVKERPGYGDRHLASDHAWVEAMRFATACSGFVEGLAAGFESDCGHEYDLMGRPELASCDKSNPPKEVGFGCWFFLSSPESANWSHMFGEAHVRRFGRAMPVGSGVAVNVGRSLRVDTRAEASKALGLPCADAPLCEMHGSAQDKLYCERAIERGYDSIQFARPHEVCERGKRCPPELCNPPELVLCTGSCMTERLTSACPRGVEFRRMGSEGPCECSNESDAINCGNDSMLYGRPDDGKQKCIEGGLKSPELFKLGMYL